MRSAKERKGEERKGEEERRGGEEEEEEEEEEERAARTRRRSCFLASLGSFCRWMGSRVVFSTGLPRRPRSVRGRRRAGRVQRAHFFSSWVVRICGHAHTQSLTDSLVHANTTTHQHT